MTRLKVAFKLDLEDLNLSLDLKDGGDVVTRQTGKQLELSDGLLGKLPPQLFFFSPGTRTFRGAVELRGKRS